MSFTFGDVALLVEVAFAVGVAWRRFVTLEKRVDAATNEHKKLHEAVGKLQAGMKKLRRAVHAANGRAAQQRRESVSPQRAV